jgi:hypothetical protein
LLAVVCNSSLQQKRYTGVASFYWIPAIPEIMLEGLADCFSGWNMRDRYAREREKSGSETSGLVGHHV